MSVEITQNFEPALTYQPVAKKWYVLSIVIGIFVVGAGGFGSLGLLHSYGIISLPKDLACLGNLSDTSLWVMTLGGLGSGGFLIGRGAYKIDKIHKLRREEDQSLLTEGIEYRRSCMNSQLSNENITNLKVPLEEFNLLENGTFICQNVIQDAKGKKIQGGDEKRCICIARTREGAFQSSQIISHDTLAFLTENLKFFGSRESDQAKAINERRRAKRQKKTVNE